MSRTGRSAVLVVSQLPPPVHGSTVMTRHLLDILASLGRRSVLVDRRFSRDVGSVGHASVAKVLAAPALVARLLVAVLLARPGAAIFFLTNRPGSFLVDCVLLTVLGWLRVPTLLYVHTTGYGALAGRGPLWRTLVRRALRSGTVVTLGPSLVADVAPFVCTPVHTVANMTVVPTELPSSADGRDVVYLSNLDQEKGATAFVRAAAELVARGTDLRFTIAGAGSAEQRSAVTDAIAAGGLEDRLTLLGPVDTAGKWALLARADVLVFPSTYRYEAQPLTIVEAMAARVPVIAYDVGGVRDLVVDGETGRLLAPGDETGLVDAVISVMADADARARLGAGGAARFAARHSAAAYRAAWERLLDMTPHTGDITADPADFAGSRDRFSALVRADWRANPRDVKSRAVLVAFRLCQWAMGEPERPRAWSYAPVAAYRFWTEFGIGMELRPRTRVGAGLTIYHGYGLVVNDHARIGARVVLRNAVTIGQRTPGGPTPLIGDGVEIGAGALVLGDITVGDGARIGAGAVVLDSVPAGAAAVGNPARVLPHA